MKKEKNVSAYKTYCQKLVTQFSSGEAREHAYRPALQEYIESFNNKLRVTNEPGKQGKGKKGDAQNKPDFIVARGQTPIGFIEAKDIGVNLDKVGKSDQIERYCEAYPNLILTDYIEFRRYVKGELRGKAIHIGKANEKKKIITFSELGEEQLTQFFEEFLLEDVESVSSPKELASRLAHLTRQVKKLVQQELKEESVRLHKLMVAFKKVLLADLDVEKFSDMFAQTLAYGFFAARVHYDGKGEFSRRTASFILPKTNPFLRRVFAEFANESLPDSLIGAVDEIVDLLRKSDIRAVLEHFGERGCEDPVIHFYESFLGEYNPKLKKAMGVFYTPDAVVSYMVRSLDQILIEKFSRKKGLADDKTLILDPALGTGSFLHKIIDCIYEKSQKGSWDSYVSENLLKRIFGFEILMAPYAVAHLNLGMQLQKTGYQFEKEQRLGVYLTNTLEETAKRSEDLFSDWLSEEAEAAAEIKRQKAIMVVVGNPPYSGESQNDGAWIRDLMHGFDNLTNKKCANYFECDAKPLGERNSKWINDDYVKFLRFAHWRIEETGHGVLAFITNHGYLDNPTFRGMREALLKDFDELYIVDLHGNSKKKEQSPDGTKDENVFQIQQGVSICFFVKNEGYEKKKKKDQKAKVYRTDLYGTRGQKFSWLSKHSFNSTQFFEVKPVSPFYLFTKQDAKLRDEYNKALSVTEIFPLYGSGMTTARDAFVIDVDALSLLERIKKFKNFEGTNQEICSEFNIPMKKGWDISSSRKALGLEKDLKKHVQEILYRPFDSRYIFYHDSVVWRTVRRVMEPMINLENLALLSARSNKSNSPNHFFVSKHPTEAKTGEATTQSTLFPLYVSVGGKRFPNIKKAILDDIRKMVTEDPEIRLFEYCYAILNSNTYRKRYAEFLKFDFPRVHLTSDKNVFKKLAKIGRQLIDLHLLESDLLDESETKFPVKGSNIIENTKYDCKECRVYINQIQYFENVVADSWEFEVGGYQVLQKWLKDRKNTKIGHDEVRYYEKIVESINRTIEIMSVVDSVISEAGGWPLIETHEVLTHKRVA